MPCEASTRVNVSATFEHRCPFVDEIDKGSISITWDTQGKTIELHSLAAWLDTFKERRISHEDLTQLVREELATPGIEVIAVSTTWRTADLGVRVDAVFREPL